MSIILLIQCLIFIVIAASVTHITFDLMQKANIRKKRREIEIVNDLAKEVDANYKDLNDLNNKKQKIKEFEQT